MRGSLPTTPASTLALGSRFSNRIQKNPYAITIALIPQNPTQPSHDQPRGVAFPSNHNHSPNQRTTIEHRSRRTQNTEDRTYNHPKLL